MQPTAGPPYSGGLSTSHQYPTIPSKGSIQKIIHVYFYLFCQTLFAYEQDDFWNPDSDSSDMWEGYSQVDKCD
jgi:hypothetical protein